MTKGTFSPLFSYFCNQSSLQKIHLSKHTLGELHFLLFFANMKSVGAHAYMAERSGKASCIVGEKHISFTVVGHACGNGCFVACSKVFLWLYWMGQQNYFHLYMNKCGNRHKNCVFAVALKTAVSLMCSCVGVKLKLIYFKYNVTLIYE